MKQINILVAGEEKRFRKKVINIAKVVKEFKIIGEADTSQDTITKATESNIDILILSENILNEPFYKVIEKVVKEKPEIIIIAILEKYEKRKMKFAISSGAKEILENPSLAVTLNDTIKKTYDREMLFKEDTKKYTVNKGKLITIFSPKGGVGKTTIATNLSLALSLTYTKKVLLIDLSLQFGDCAIGLDIRPTYNIYDLAKDICQKEFVDPDEYFDIHTKSGVYVLPSPDKPELAEFITSQHVSKIFDTYKDYFDYIIVDCPNYINEITLVCFDKADRIFLVSGVDISTIKNTSYSLKLLSSLNIDQKKVKIITNMATEKLGIKYNDIETTLEHSLWVKIPYDRDTAVKSMNRGEPLLLSAKRNPISKSIQQIADSIIDII